MATAVVQRPEFTFDDATHTYIRMPEKRRVLSVTQHLDFAGFVDYANAPDQVLERKSKIGVAVHRACEILATPERGELDWDTVPDQGAGYVLAYESFVGQYQFRAKLAECRGIFVTEFGTEFAYTFDQLGLIMFKGQLVPILIELKCAFAEEPSWRVQLAAYHWALPPAKDLFPECGIDYYIRAALHLKPTGEPKLLRYEDASDLRAFQWALAVNQWKLNHGIKFDKR